MMPRVSKIGWAGPSLLGGLAVLAAVARAEAGPPSPMPPESETVGVAAPEALEAAQGARAAPRFVYASGFQGVGYYASPGTTTAARQAPAPTSSGRTQSVGPGVRDWSTGRRGRLHKPWLQPR